MNLMKTCFAEVLNSQANLTCDIMTGQLEDCVRTPEMHPRLQTSVPSVYPIHTAMVGKEKTMFPCY